ncbi:hypothetical protein BC834DRAFT_965699 [Gloeopeniophorella convolvens]|nr:hypothetical protein BC834DRAFT_965699 [Gloeopeniophorella convolvens]
MAAPLGLQFGPFSVDEQTGEPYLRLPMPHEHIVIAVPRMQDAPQICEIFNDPRVYRWVSRPPFPYLMEHAIAWQEGARADSFAVWRELQQADVKHPNGPLKIVGGCPVRSILQGNPDGSFTYLGDCGMNRHQFDDIMDPEEKAKLVEENEARLAGDPEIIWSMGVYLRPSHHGKGIMTAVIGVLMNSWGIPRMNIHCSRPSAFDGNTGSLRVFEKNGFVLCKSIPECMRTPAKGEFPEELRTVHFIEWRRGPRDDSKESAQGDVGGGGGATTRA